MFNVYMPRRTYMVVPVLGILVFLIGLADSVCWLVLDSSMMPNYASLLTMFIGLWLQSGYRIRLRRQ